MPIGFAKSILTTGGVSVANTQAATWNDAVSGAVDFTNATGKFSNGLVTQQQSSTVDNTDTTIKIFPSNTNFRFNASNAYTIEFFMSFTNNNDFPQSHELFEIAFNDTEGLDATTNNYGKITANGSSVFFFTVGGDQTEGRSGDFNNSAFVHVAIVSNGSGQQAWYKNGSRLIGGGVDNSYTYSGNAQAIAIGNRGTRNATSPQVVYDEIRISDIARYSGTTYTVPTSAFTPDANTIALFHCDGNKLDSSRG